MSPRHLFSPPPLQIAGIVVGVVAGGALLALTIAFVTIGASLSVPEAGMVVLAAAVGFVLYTAWLCHIVRRLAKLERGGGGEEGEPGGGWRWSGPDPTRPPSEGPDWWPEFERDLHAYLEARERAPVGD